mgnify:CR=1 FL=1
MSNRKKLIEEITADFNAIKNKIHAKIMHGQRRDITYSQQFALLIVSQTKDLGIKEISKMLCTSSSATTQLVNELVKQGFVIRKTNSKDRRALHLVISKKGQVQIVKAKKQNTKMMSALFYALNDKELDSYIKLNKKILSKI